MKQPVLLIVGMLGLISMVHPDCRRIQRQSFPIGDVHFIKTCVEATLALDPGLNRVGYWLDVSKMKRLDGRAVDSFFRLEPTATRASLDSLERADSSWVREGFFQQPVICLGTCDTLANGLLEVHTTKVKALDGAIGTKLVLKKVGEDYECVSKEITTIS
jgi:hypothetical protein